MGINRSLHTVDPNFLRKSSFSLGHLAIPSIPPVVAEHRNLVADLGQAGDGAGADLLLQLLVGEVGGDQDRALGLVALVDQGVELLEDPVGAFLGS